MNWDHLDLHPHQCKTLHCDMYRAVTTHPVTVIIMPLNKKHHLYIISDSVVHYLKLVPLVCVVRVVVLLLLRVSSEM